MMLSTKLLEAAGNAATTPVYVEDVFSTYLYTGNGSSQVIDNGINLGSSNSGGSVYFDGSGDYLETPTSSAFAFGTGDFTSELWVYLSRSNGTIIYEPRTSSNESNPCIAYGVVSANKFEVANSAIIITSSSTFGINQWHHVALVRSGTTLTLWVNGTNQGSTTLSTNLTNNDRIRIGEYFTAGTYAFQGYVSNLRVVKGTAVYTSAFTPSTTPLTAVSGTSLLVCQGPTPLLDKSTNAFSVTVNGDSSAKGFGPFTSATAGKGGLVWVKGRNETYYHRLASSPGPTLPNYLASNATDAASSGNGNISAFLTSGFTVNNNGGTGGTNSSGINYVSWTFRKQPKFFDVQTATTNGSSNYGSTVPSMTIAHNLGSIPGCVIVKRTDGTGGFYTWHRGLASTLYYVSLNTTSASTPYGGNVNGTGGWIQATSTHIYLDAWFNTYEPGNYVVYIFAHDAGGFGLTGTDNVISCGSFTTDGSGNATVNLGYEPQWVLYKRTSSTGNWLIIDNMRGDSANATNNANYLLANTSDAEGTATWFYPTATGFTGNANSIASTDFIYIAIRRGPMKVPTSGTSVFSPQVQTPTGATNYVMAGSSGFPIDWLPTKQKDTVVDWYQTSRLTNNYMSPNTTAAEGAYTYGFGLMQGVSAQWNTNPTVSYAFRRAPSFFDEVCYTGNGSTQNITHNLGVAPEFLIVKPRNSSAYDWNCYHVSLGNTKYIALNTTLAASSAVSLWNNTTPTSTVFTVNHPAVNDSGGTYVAYLFATCAGVSKVGSYTGTGSSLTIDCGFTSGARFVMIKCTTQAYDWMVFDTAKGINSATEPFLVINSNNAQNTISSGSIYDLDWIDPHSTGFTLPNNYGYVNASGENYIYLAIA